MSYDLALSNLDFVLEPFTAYEKEIVKTMQPKRKQTAKRRRRVRFSLEQQQATKKQKTAEDPALFNTLLLASEILTAEGPMANQRIRPLIAA